MPKHHLQKMQKRSVQIFGHFFLHLLQILIRQKNCTKGRMLMALFYYTSLHCNFVTTFTSVSKHHLDQRSYMRWLYKRIHKTEMKFWAVLGSRGCSEKKTPNCHKYAIFGGGFFNCCGQKKISIKKNIFYLASTLKSYIA